MGKFETTDYLVVNISDPLDEKITGCKCIPAVWAEKNDIHDNDLIIRYPEEENSETELQKSYEEALEFITENDKRRLPNTVKEQLDFTMNKAETGETPSTSLKRRPPEYNDKNTTINEDRKKNLGSGIDFMPSLKDTVSALGGLIRNLAPTTSENGTKNYGTVDIKNVEDIYISILEVKSKLNAVYKEKNLTLEKAFESVGFFPPAFKKVLNLPTTTKKQPNTMMNKAETGETPSKSLKRRLPEDNDKNTTINEEKLESDIDSMSSLNNTVSALGGLIRHLAPTTSENGTKNYGTVDIKHVEDMYNSILEVKSKLNAVYKEKNLTLGKAFESVGFFPPAFKKDLNLKSQGPKFKKPAIQQSKPSARSKPPPQLPTPSKFPTPCRVVDKWTLQHEGPGPGLTELMPNTGIYVYKHLLSDRLDHATEIRQLARLLLPLIFSDEAFARCSYTGLGPNGKRSKSKRIPPGLDEYARNTLMAFVTNHAKKSGWEIVSPKVMNSAMNHKLRVIREKALNVKYNNYKWNLMNGDVPKRLWCKEEDFKQPLGWKYGNPHYSIHRGSDKYVFHSFE